MLSRDCTYSFDRIWRSVNNPNHNDYLYLGRRGIYFWIWNLYTPTPKQDIVMFESDTTGFSWCFPRFWIYFWIVFSITFNAWISSLFKQHFETTKTFLLRVLYLFRYWLNVIEVLKQVKILHSIVVNRTMSYSSRKWYTQCEIFIWLSKLRYYN